MAKVSKKQMQVEQHLQGAEEAVTDENLGSALKWFFKLPKAFHFHSMAKPIDYLKANPIETSPLYAESSPYPVLAGRVLALGQSISKLAEVHEERGEAGLVFVLAADYTHAHGLTFVGFNVLLRPYAGISEPERFNAYSQEDYKNSRKIFTERQSHIDSVVGQILDDAPKLVLSPLLKRVGRRSDYDEKDPLFDPEGVIIYRRLQEVHKAANVIKFLGISDISSDDETWKYLKVPFVGHERTLDYGIRVKVAVKETLGVR